MIGNHTIRIKICGFTDPEQAKAAALMGANAIGIVFAKSPRQVSPEKAKQICLALPPFVQSVGVFVNEKPEKIRQIASFCHLDLIQLHGDEDPEFCSSLGLRVIKAFCIRDKQDIEKIHPYEGRVQGVLLDAWSRDSRGGTGRTFDWSLAKQACQSLALPVILAGGLNPENVTQAIKLVRPYGVDTSSGVEESPGQKDPNKVQAFIGAVRSCHE